MRDLGGEDLFVSYASEDRDSFVRPLVKILTDFGVHVWWDELALKVGDSLSRSIDQGLARCSFGVVVISAEFLRKRWPEYELRGLAAREIAAGKVVLPLWYGVTHSEVLAFSPPLADKKAVVVEQPPSPDTILRAALALIDVVRPDIFTRIHRRVRFVSEQRKSRIEKVDRSKIRYPPPRHAELPPELLGRVRLIRAALLGAYPHTMKFWVDGFRRDAHPSREVAVWERIAASYLEIVQAFEMSKESRESVMQFLLSLSMSPEGSPDLLTPELRGESENAFRAIMSSSEPLIEVPNETDAFEGTDETDEPSSMDLEHFPHDLPAEHIDRLADMTFDADRDGPAAPG